MFFFIWFPILAQEPLLAIPGGGFGTSTSNTTLDSSSPYPYAWAAKMH